MESTLTFLTLILPLLEALKELATGMQLHGLLELARAPITPALPSQWAGPVISVAFGSAIIAAIFYLLRPSR